jgi:ribonucleoside-diphosphate reductase alpha chain
LNLSEFIHKPFTDEAYVDSTDLREAVITAVHALNDVLIEGLELHPLQEQRDSVRDWRQIGLGIMGLADMLLKLGYTYGSESSREFVDNITSEIAATAITESARMARTMGKFPKCDINALTASKFYNHIVNYLSEDTVECIKKYGLYNSQLLTCAPTGSIGTMLECSTGIEPVFAFSYNRTTQSLHGKEQVYKVDAKIVKDYKEVTGNTELPSYFVSSADIPPINRILMQATIQNNVDAAISSTINLPEDALIEEVEEIYMQAWKYGLKGVTVYRQNCQRAGILTTDSKPKEIETTKSAPKRLKTLQSDNYVVSIKGEKYLISIGLLNDKPYELFITKLEEAPEEKYFKGTITKVAKQHYKLDSDYCTIDKLGESTTEVQASALYISMLLRHGVDIKFITKISKKVNNIVSSLSAAIARVLSKYIPKEETGDKCPECGEPLINEGGCIHCPSCGWSKCS